MRDTLAPLIKPEMKGYQELKRDTFEWETDSPRGAQALPEAANAVPVEK